MDPAVRPNRVLRHLGQVAGHENRRDERGKHMTGPPVRVPTLAPGVHRLVVPAFPAPRVRSGREADVHPLWLGLADAVVAVHYAYMAYLVVGGFIAWRWRWTIWTARSRRVWAIAIVATKVPCPLTALQNHFRESAGRRRCRTASSTSTSAARSTRRTSRRSRAVRWPRSSSLPGSGSCASSGGASTTPPIIGGPDAVGATVPPSGRGDAATR